MSWVCLFLGVAGAAFDSGLFGIRAISQRPQYYLLIKEYSLHHIRDPTIIYGTFLNYGALGSLILCLSRL